MTHVLITRLDSEGDVLLAGPAIRAVDRPGAGPRGPGRRRSAGAAGPCARARPRRDPRLVPPEPVADGARAPARRGPARRRGIRGLPRLAARRPPPRASRPARGRALA